MGGIFRYFKYTSLEKTFILPGSLIINSREKCLLGEYEINIAKSMLEEYDKYMELDFKSL